MEEAKQILETTKASVENIAMTVGYEDISPSRRIFKRKCAITPSEHRRMFGRERFAAFATDDQNETGCN